MVQPRGFGKPRFAGVKVRGEAVTVVVPRWLAEKEGLA